MRRYLALLLLLPLGGCAGLSIGSISGTSSISLTCGTTVVNYSAGLIPQMQPVTATCTDPTTGKEMSAGITPGLDIATIAALVKQNMAMHGEILKPQ
jgi:hypothetical protein